jgi:hypothetical protein
MLVMLFAQAFPTISRWINEQGWIEMGADEYSDSLLRALDPGGLVWESDAQMASIDEALMALEEALKTWFRQNE